MERDDGDGVARAAEILQTNVRTREAWSTQTSFVTDFVSHQRLQFLS